MFSLLCACARTTVWADMAAAGFFFFFVSAPFIRSPPRAYVGGALPDGTKRQ